MSVAGDSDGDSDMEIDEYAEPPFMSTEVEPEGPVVEDDTFCAICFWSHKVERESKSVSDNDATVKRFFKMYATLANYRMKEAALYLSLYYHTQLAKITTFKYYSSDKTLRKIPEPIWSKKSVKEHLYGQHTDSEIDYIRILKKMNFDLALYIMRNSLFIKKGNRLFLDSKNTKSYFEAVKTVKMLTDKHSSYTTGKRKPI